MKTFYLTFRERYSDVPHPYWSGATSAGWVRIVADSENTARIIAQQFFGKVWAFLYSENFFYPDESRKSYPLGEILVLQQKDRIRLQDAIDNTVGVIVPAPDLGTFTDPSEEKASTSESEGLSRFPEH